jgi:hypothetical protein
MRLQTRNKKQETRNKKPETRNQKPEIMKTNSILLVLLVFIGLSQIHAQVGIGTTTPDASSELDLSATDKGFLPPRLTTAQRDAIASPAEGLTIYNTNNDCLETYNGTYWISICNGTIANGACAGEPTEFIFDGLTYKPVVSNGKCWLDRNLGVSQVATSSGDAGSYGDLFQWGRAADGHENRNSDLYDGSSVRPNSITESGAWDGKFITIPNNTNRNDWVTTITDDAWNTGTEQAPIKTVTDPCPSGYRVPTETELEAERLSWNSNDAAGAFASPLKLPVAGSRRRVNGVLINGGSVGAYWSSRVSGSDASFLSFDSSGAGMSISSRANGLSIRCLKD